MGLERRGRLRVKLAILLSAVVLFVLYACVWIILVNLSLVKDVIDTNLIIKPGCILFSHYCEQNLFLSDLHCYLGS